MLLKIDSFQLEIVDDLDQLPKEAWKKLEKVMVKDMQLLPLAVAQMLIFYSPSFKGWKKWLYFYKAFWWNIRSVKGTNYSVFVWVTTQIVDKITEVLFELETVYSTYLKILYPESHFAVPEKVTFYEYRTADRLLFENKLEEAARVLCRLPEKTPLSMTFVTLVILQWSKNVDAVKGSLKNFFQKHEDEKEPKERKYQTDWASIIHFVAEDPLKYAAVDQANWLDILYGINKKLKLAEEAQRK